jgi:hypothetical protein
MRHQPRQMHHPEPAIASFIKAVIHQVGFLIGRASAQAQPAKIEFPSNKVCTLKESPLYRKSEPEGPLLTERKIPIGFGPLKTALIVLLPVAVPLSSAALSHTIKVPSIVAVVGTLHNNRSRFDRDTIRIRVDIS